MRKPVYSAQFRRDLKKVGQRMYDMQKLKVAVNLLLAEAPLPERYKDHALKGKWNHYRELYIAPDWLLLYKLSNGDCIFSRTGTHSDIFSL